MDCNKLTEVDEYALEKEWTEHPGRFMECCDLLNEARAEQDRIENDYAVLTAKLSLEFRESPREYGVDYKITENTVTQFLDTQPEIIRMKEKLRTINFEVRKYEKLVKAMEKKTKSLENLVHLMSMQYYNSEPKERKGVHPDVVKKVRSKAVAKRIRDSMNPSEEGEESDE